MNIKNLKFKDSLFDAVICLNAKLPVISIYDSLNGIKIIAADGAALKLMDIGVGCDYIIGDLDSFYQDERSALFTTQKIIHLPDQNKNDFEKILDYCIEHNLHNLLITGMHGGELEHTLNNQSILNRYAGKLNLCIYDEGRYGIPVSESIRFDCQKGEIISIIPQLFATLSTKNLQWELDNFSLKFGQNEGARNRATDNFVEILLINGFFMLFIDSKVPKCPFFL
jgi:thiamine pyrophosphokinase